MKIAMLGTRGIPASYSGFETCVEQVGKRLAARGHDVVVYCRRGRTGTGAARHYLGMERVILPAIRTKGMETLSHTLVSAAHAMVRARPDAAIVFGVGNAIFCRLLGWGGIPSVINVDGADWARKKWGALGRRYLHWSERIATTAADAVIADSHAVNAYYEREYHAAGVFIPYGAEVSADAGTATLAHFGLQPRRYLLAVGRFVPENGFHHLIKAYAEVESPMPFVVVGDAPYSEEYKRSLKAMAPAGVIFTGYQFGSAYQELSRHAYAFLFAAEVGGTHPVLVEQLAHGNCVLARWTESNAEVMGDAGIFFRDDAEIVRVVSAFGVDQISLRALARGGGDENRIVTNALLLKALASVAAVLIFAGAAWYLRFSPAMWVGWALLSADFFLSAGALSLVSYHQASVRADRAVPAVILGTVASLALGVVAFALHAPMPWFVASIPAGNAVALLALWLITRRWVRPSIRLASRAELVTFAGAAWPLAVTGAIVLLYFRVSTLMLAKLEGLNAVASYTPAYKLSEAFLLLPAALAGTTLPVLAGALRRGPSRAGIRAYESALLVSLALSVPFAIGATVLGRFVLTHLFGPSYAASALALAILGWATVLMSLNIQTTNALIALNRERLVMAVTVVNLATNIVANLILIPRLSFNGSAYATLATEGVNFAMQAVLVAYFLRRSRWHPAEAAVT